MTDEFTYITLNTCITQTVCVCDSLYSKKTATPKIRQKMTEI